MHRIFISYSRKDVGFVRRLARDLESAGHEVWWDLSNIRGGDDWVRVIPEAIDASEDVIVVLSPHSLVSEWVRREYTQALHHHKKVVPLMLVSTTMPFALNTLNYIDFTVEEEYTSSFISLLRALEDSATLPAVPVTRAPGWPGSYVIPITLIVFLLLALVASLSLKLPLPRVTPALLQSTATTGPPASVTLPPALSATALAGPTYTPVVTQTPAFQRLTFCVNSRSVNSINVRSGPGIDYARIGEPLPVGTCLDFRGQNEEGTWLLVAADQSNRALRQYEGGWISRPLLGLGRNGSIDLPAITLTPAPTQKP